MKRLMLTLAVFVMSLAAAQEAPEGFPVTIKDGLGRELTFQKPPERVVCFWSACIERMATIDVIPVATVSPWNTARAAEPHYFGAAAKDIMGIPMVDDNPDPEMVAAARPDLIVVLSAEHVKAYEGIAPVFADYAGTGGSLQAIMDDTRKFARLFGTEKEQVAEDKIKRFTDRLEAYSKRAPHNVTIMHAGFDGRTIGLRTKVDPVCGDLFNRVGICAWENAPGQGDSWSYETNIENLLKLNPDVLVFMNWGSATADETLAAVNQDPLWAEINAVKNKRVIMADVDVTIQGPTNGILVLDALVPAIYPNLFPEGPLTNEQVQELLAGED